MTYAKAYGIAQDFMNDMNPTMWDGNGDVPSTFDNRCWEYDLSPDMRLDISFWHDNEDGWYHCCELVDVESLYELPQDKVDDAMNLLSQSIDYNDYYWDAYWYMIENVAEKLKLKEIYDE